MLHWFGKKHLAFILQGFVLGITCFLAPNAFANPTFPIVSEDKEDFSDRSCPSFTPITNTLSPNVSSLKTEDLENLGVPTSDCAADLMGVSGATLDRQGYTPFSDQESFESFYRAQTNGQDISPESSDDEETQSTENQDDRWHFSFQPYVTVPVSTYGSATVRGRKVNYSLSLGELLQSLRVTASGRVEAWKGRWGFIMDGYYVSLRNVGSSQISRTRTPDALNALDYLLSRSLNGNLQELVNSLDQKIQTARNNEELRKNEIFQELDQQVQDLQNIVAQDAQDLRDLELKFQELRESLARSGQKLEVLDLEVEELELNLNTQGFADRLALDVRNSSSRRSPQELAEIQSLGRLPDLGQLQQELIQTRDLLEQGAQMVRERREEQDSEELQKLEAEIQEAQALVEQEIQTINEIQDFQENRLPQQLDANSSTDLQFSQGIYDFAVSYHIGDLPQYQLSDQPSNRRYPLIWFQPIVGVRLNDLNLEIEATLDVKLSSSLVNFQGTFQQTFTQGRTWFEPMIGGKFGIQVSDPIVLWLRGDISGFGLAGDTDLSWNFLFGVDWWVQRNLSLQVAYRFYGINYQNGSGDNAFGFEQYFNGPYLSATFHF